MIGLLTIKDFTFDYIFHLSLFTISNFHVLQNNESVATMNYNEINIKFKFVIV